MDSIFPLAAHQDAAISWLLSRDSGAVLYAPGTGKTRIIWTTAKKFGGRTLVLVPNSLVEQTMEEAEKWFPGEILPHLLPLYENMTLKNRAKLLRYDSDWQYLLLSHESLSHKQIGEALRRIPFNFIAVDEASRFRNYSKRTRHLLQLQGEKKAIFTGTPIVRSPSDIFYPMKFLAPQWCGITRKDIFDKEYCLLGGYTGLEPLDIRPDRIDQFNAYLDPHRISCTLSDIRDMPERISSTRYVDLSAEQAKAYYTLRDTLRLEIERENDRNFELNVRSYVGRLQRLQEISAGFARNIKGDVEILRGGKSTELCEILRDRVPSVVWTWWTVETEYIHRLLCGAGYKAVRLNQGGREAFLSGEASILVANIAAGGYGLNLDRAERMIYHSMYWGVDAMAQSLDRNYRMDTEKNKYVIYLVARGTVDEYIREKLALRAGMSQKLTRSEALELLC